MSKGSFVDKGARRRQESPQGLVHLTVEGKATQREPHSLSFGEAFCWYQRVVYDADAIAEGVASTLRELGSRRVLDCAAGSGLPALQLHQKYGGEDGRLHLIGGSAREQIVDLVCSDGSKTMVDEFDHNARVLGVKAHCGLVNWADLEAPHGLYDFILCRGNSLVYATTWDGGDDVAESDGLQIYLNAFASVLAPGGFVQIDAPQHMELQEETKEVVTHYDAADAAVEVIESVAETARSRHWICTVNVEPSGDRSRTLTFALHSAKVTIDDLERLLVANQFETVRKFQLPGDRPGHQTILARLVQP